MKLSQCAALVTVADCGSFTKAARQLGISQSAISHAIAGLETELGCTLLIRDRSGTRISDAGRELLEHARTMLTNAEQMRRTAQAVRNGHHRPVRFATSQSFATRLLPAVMRRFHTRFPHQEIELREGTDQQIAEWLRRRAVDVGVVTLPKTDLTTVPLWQDEIVVVLPVGHPLAGEPAVLVRQLADEPLLMPIGGVEPVIRAVLRLAGADLTVSYRMRDLAALLALVAEGIGVTVLPGHALPAVLPGVVVRSLSPALPRQVALAVREHTDGSSAVREFIGTIRGLVNRESRVRT
jgi:DNA-binding transcriptional LysR family regulator